MNRLKDSKSPYLLQHKNNPVDWYEWSDEAFKKARKENKPVFLSIGYSTCHWCHVMEKESFEDRDIAKLLNEDFVCVKVDREERPDIDDIYMSVCHIMSGQGGWPLSIIMTPDKKPFFAATYIPKYSQQNRIGLLDLIPSIKNMYSQEHEKIIDFTGKIKATLDEYLKNEGKSRVSKDVLDEGVSQLSGNFDTEFGGFGNAPKFPTPHNLIFLLRMYVSTKDERLLFIVKKTLEAMRLGGIFDHIGFGFHRYSTDRQWLIPHFEKMLYDQAMLSIAYTEAFLVTKDEFYKQTCIEILEFIKNELQSSSGGFYTALDADSEGKEGKFYVFTEKELKSILNEKQFELARKIFSFSKEGNFFDPHNEEDKGMNVLFLQSRLGDESLEDVEEIRKLLLNQRSKRVRPQRDEKILCDLNGLTVAAFAIAARAYDDSSYLKVAKRAGEFIVSQMIDDNGNLLHRFFKDESSIDGFLDDYSFSIWGFLELYRSSFETDYLKMAKSLCDRAIDNFYDEKEGGFFFTSNTSEKLIAKKKQWYDGAVPSGNSIMLSNLIRLNELSGESRYLSLAQDSFESYFKSLSKSPANFTMHLSALLHFFSEKSQVVISGPSNDKPVNNFIGELNKKYLPYATVMLKDTKGKNGHLSEIAPFTKDMHDAKGRANVYICKDFKCLQPISDLQEALEILGIGEKHDI